MVNINSKYAKGQRVLIRDAEWSIRDVEKISDNNYKLVCDGVSNFVKGKEVIFITKFEDEIIPVNPMDTNFVQDLSPNYKKSLIYMEAMLKDIVPTENIIYRADKAAMNNVKYQFEPAIQALKQPRARILMADAVGLGKTLEAGILVTELIKRGKAKRILVLAVKSMLTQFQKEFWNRFTIPLTRLDSQGIQRVRRNIPANMNPFFYYDKSIISIDTLKQEALYRSYIEQAYWDVIIIDEAHNVADRNSGSQKSKLAKMISKRCDSLIMLSATPHDGSARSFASILNMLDPTAIANPDDYTIDDFKHKGLVSRRFKKDIISQVGDDFKERKISTLKTDASCEEEEVFNFISNLSFNTLDKVKRKGSQLFKTTLIKSLLSSPIACLETIDNRVNKIKKENPDNQIENYSDDIEKLLQLKDKVKKITLDKFSKYQSLVSLINSKMKWKKSTNDRIVIFTERIASLNFLADNLLKDLNLKKEQVAILHGSMSDIDLNIIVEDFGQESSKIRLLIASDVASEGINLHFQSHKLIHFDIPWSLMVFQQRNGRIDRYGQEKNPEIYYLETESENPEFKGDNRILEILIAKDERAAKNIGDPSVFMKVNDIEKEEEFVANAIESKIDPEMFSQKLDDNANIDDEHDILAQLNKLSLEKENEDNDNQKGIFYNPPSLFAGDIDFAKDSLQYLEKNTDIFKSTDIRYEEERIEINAAKVEDLRYRFKMLPKEITPDNWYFILSSDLNVIKNEIINSRKEETAWPKIHYLWEQHPIMEWLKDKVLSNFNRLEAPVMFLNTLENDKVIYIINGLIPNKKAQPIINEWVGVLFKNNVFCEILPFEKVIQKTELGQKTFSNPVNTVDLSDLKNNLEQAINKSKEYIINKRKDYDDKISEKVIKYLYELDVLKQRHNEYIEKEIHSKEKQDEKKREIEEIFNSYNNWIKDSMETEKEPFIQVISVLKGAK